MTTENASENQPETEPMLRWFAYTHLPKDLRDVSQAFSLLADHVATTLPRNPERTVALRKLLEAKDAAVRAALDTEIAPAGAVNFVVNVNAGDGDPVELGRAIGDRLTSYIESGRTPAP